MTGRCYNRKNMNRIDNFVKFYIFLSRTVVFIEVTVQTVHSDMAGGLPLWLGFAHISWVRQLLLMDTTVAR